jgi:HAD superfamily hydrolase (TIGR01509 family)
MIEAIIFDMDGTLVDTEPFNTLIERRQFEINKIPVSEEEHKAYMGIASETMWRKLAGRYKVETPVSALIEQNRIESFRFFSELSEIPVMPGLFEFLELLREKAIPVAVASSSTPEMIDLILEKARLKKYFKVIVSTQEAGKSKPAPDVFLLAASKLGVKPEQCLVVEDSKSGIEAAYVSGMMCVAFQVKDTSLQKQVRAVICNFMELSEFL